ncbi:MAG: undecaprenyldiphospho-muramoylpentapeptide beta-N-acetylglucosaminyltransferase [Piscirickettsiaceae bacterium]|nr:undecaprenyldiphospho-muramoylpentapeptide beta-N-acetylglucosaminyltransferase [Piscirickettsiaceae bacterium]
MIRRVLIMAGGTGGHVLPGLAVAEELRNRSVDVFWMGTKKGIESQLVVNAGFPINYITVYGLRGNGVLGWLFAPLKVVKAVFEALKIMDIVKPDVAFGLGGFTSGPGGVAIKLCSRPLAIHEQNAVPGLTNRLLSHLSQKVMEAFFQSFPKNIDADWVGNPVRLSMENVVEPRQRLKDRTGPLRILVLGGSLGSSFLNTFMPVSLSLLDESQRPYIKHQCGEKHIGDCQRSYAEVNISADIVEFIDDMAASYSWADLVICRAGALTIAELSAIGVASILIPYPYAVDDHQTHNASVLVKVGAAQLIQERSFTPILLAEKMKHLICNRNRLLTMAQAARLQARFGAAKYVSNTCMGLSNA